MVLESYYFVTNFLFYLFVGLFRLLLNSLYVFVTVIVVGHP